MKGPCVRAQESVRDALEEHVKVLRSHVKAAAAHDVEGIHDLRVASRRLRAVLSGSRGRFRKRAMKKFQDRVRAITRGLGKARELDVSIHLLEDLRNHSANGAHGAFVQTERMLRALREAESKSVDESCALVRGKGFAGELKALREADKQSSKCYRKETRATLRRRHKKVCETYHEWGHAMHDVFDDSLHAVRVAFKKLRYSCEIAKPLYGHRMHEFIDQIKAAQEALGDWNDVRVLRNYTLEFSRKYEELKSEFDALKNICNERALMDLGKFVQVAPALFEKHAQATTIKLIAKQNVDCCIRRKPDAARSTN